MIPVIKPTKDENYYYTRAQILNHIEKRSYQVKIDYINEIRYIERPYWNDEASKAHEIRRKRNLVHAKLGIDSNEINEETCRIVIDYLRDVLKNRGITE